MRAATPAAKAWIGIVRMGIWGKLAPSKAKLKWTLAHAIGELMNGGSIEILSGEGSPLAVLGLSDPAATPAAGSELELNPIAEEDAAFANGTATAARIVAADGSEVFTCDVGGEDSDAVIKLSGEIVAGAPVRISSFRLAMP